jgi:serine O-acetyltransferase
VTHTAATLAAMVSRQIENFIPDGHDAAPAIAAAMPKALQRTRHCVNQVKAWREGGFDALVSGQYATLLYLLSRQVWLQEGDAAVATRLFLVNKALNAMELFYEIELPEVFLLGHTPGLVLAKATYGLHLVLHQNCTVGRKLNGDRPVIESGVVLFPGAMVTGRCLLRANTVVAPGVCLVDTDTPGDCYMVNSPEGVVAKPARREVWRDYFVA